MRRALMALLDASTDDALVAWAEVSVERRVNKDESDRRLRRSEAKKKVWTEEKLGEQ